MSNIVTTKSPLNQRLERISVKDFMLKLLNGVAIAIVIGLIPNAITGELFKALIPYGSIFQFLASLVSGVQFAVPLLIGVLVGVQFKFTPVEIACMGCITFISSGVVSVVENGWKIAGIGDLINTMLVAALAVLFIRFLNGRLGSMTIILLPVLSVVIVGAIGWSLLPYVKQITAAIGTFIAHVLQLQPLLMSIIIGICFALIIISPVSTVAIGLAVGINGLGSGAANMGIAACAMCLVVGSLKVNKIGVTLAVFLGSMKLFMGNWLRYPIMNIPIVINGAFAGLLAYIFNIQGTPASAGFGFSGLVGPINAYKYLTQPPFLRIAILFLAYFVLTFAFAWMVDFVCSKILKLYKHDIFLFEANN